MAAIEWDESASAAANARLRLPAAAREYFQAGRRLAKAAAPGPAALHAFRLRTKRFRYTLEMFREIYGEPLEEYLGALRKVQNYLGDINDCASTRVLVFQAMPSPSPLRRKIERALDGRTGALTVEFLAYWRGEFDRAREEVRWRAFLAQRAPRPVAPKAAKTGA